MIQNNIEYFQNIINKSFCSKCKFNTLELSQEMAHLKCSNCSEVYGIKHFVVDMLNNPSAATNSELKGMAIENGFNEYQIKEFQIRRLEELAGFSKKFEQTEKDNSHYYLQTKLNFDQALKELKRSEFRDVLEIGSCHDYYFLAPFKDTSNCFALNIHFDLPNNHSFDLWPHKIIADMNILPFKDESFDLIIISATSHHSTTPESLINEISRILKVDGQCLMINDPTWGIIKNLGGPDNTLAYRESHINENEYSIWRYNRMFRKANLGYKHLFSDYYDNKLDNLNITSKTRFAFIARIVGYVWKIKIIKNIIKKFLLWPAQAIFGFPMNVILTKK